MNELDIISTLELEAVELGEEISPELYPTPEKLNKVLKADSSIQTFFDSWNLNKQKVKIPIQWDPHANPKNEASYYNGMIYLNPKTKITIPVIIHEMDHWLRDRTIGDADAFLSEKEKK